MEDTQYLHDIIKKINKDPEWFEQMVLCVLGTDHEFYNQFKNILGVDGHLKKKVEDFSTREHNILWRVIKEFREWMGANPTPITVAFARGIMLKMASRAEEVGLSEIPELLQNMGRSLELGGDKCQNAVKTGFSHWFKKRRASYCLRMQGSEGYTNEQLMIALQYHQSLVEVTDNPYGLYNFGHGLDSEPIDVKRYSTGLRGLDNAMGGGVAKGESSLLIAASGCGKTALSAQIAITLTQQRLKGVFISTEQKHHDLELRCLSNACNIPFSLIKDKFDKNAINPTQLADYVKFRELINKNLVFSDWNFPDKSLADALEDLLRHTKARLGGLDFVILDWIGGSISSKAGVDKDARRLEFQRIADTTVRFARQHDLISIDCAQAQQTLGYDRLKVDQSCIAENKTLGVNKTNVFGITGFRVKEEDEDRNTPLLKNEQAIYISKARKGEGGSVSVRRQMGFQRFADAA